MHFVRSLHHRYQIALGLIALFSLLSYLALNVMLRQQRDHAQLVDISGKQRVLSQRIALLCTGLAYVHSPAERNRLRKSLTQNISLMKGNHRALLQSRKKQFRSLTSLPAIQDYYYKAPIHLDREVGRYLTLAQQWLRLPSVQHRSTHPKLRLLQQLAHHTLLRKLDGAVKLYVKESRRRVSRIELFETLALLLTLLTLVLEVKFIFQPMIKQVLSERQRLKEEKSYINSILQAVGEAILALDNEGRILTVNRAACELFGLSREALQGRQVQSLLVSSLDPMAPDSLGQTQRCEGLHASEGHFPLLFQIHRTAYEDREVYTMLLRNLTAQLAAERSKSEFVSIVSHELRTPLTALRGCLGLLSSEVFVVQQEQGRELLEIAHANSLRLHHLIDDLLDLQKIEAGKLPINSGEFSIVEALHTSVEHNRGYAELYDSHIELNAVPDKLTVYADKNRVLQVLNNLLSNALKFSPRHSNIQIQAHQDEQGIRIEVHDQGPGISEDFASQLFHRFSQADASSRRQSGGTGLGLSISKALVEQMEGQIGYENKAQGGAVFYFVLPQSVENS